MPDKPDSHHPTGKPTAVNRRDFLKAGALGVAAGAAASCTEPGAEAATLGAQASSSASAADASPQGLPAPPAQPLAAPPLDPVRIGFVGVGGMGTAHVRNLVRIDGCVITAVCDIRAEHAERAAAIIEEAGHPRPAFYTRGERDFERLCAEADLDLVYTATPWRWHVPVCVAAMENGKHAATEVPAAYTLDDCWRLVETAERTERHCVMMENVNYGPRRTPLPQPRAARGCSERSCTPSAATCMTCVRSSSPTRARGSGGARTRGRATATFIPPTAWARSPTAWTSTGATASPPSCR